MRHVAPDGPVYQAGTLSGNPLAMAAGLTTLKILRDNPVIYQELERRSGLLESGIKRYAHSAGIPICINRVGSMICLFFTDIDVKDYDTALTSNTRRYVDYFKHMLEHGIYLPPSQFETFFVSAAHTDEDIEHTIEAMSKAFSHLAD
jgi:glutamate-1-semialdehyde 2,1-aminomutase